MNQVKKYQVIGQGIIGAQVSAYMYEIWVGYREYPFLGENLDKTRKLQHGTPCNWASISGDLNRIVILGGSGPTANPTQGDIRNFIDIGQWEQQWGNSLQNAVAKNCSFDCNNWPGTQVFLYPTDTGGATGQRTNPQGMAAYPGDIFLLMHRMNTDPSATPVAWKLRVMLPTPGAGTWTELFAIDVTLTDAKDQSANTYYTDCQMMFDEYNRRATIFARNYWRFSSGVANSVFANVWSVHIPQEAIDAANSALCTVLHTQITTSTGTLRLQANCMNSYGDYMIKANQLNDALFGYQHIEDVGWSDLWSVLDWKTALKTKMSVVEDFIINGSGPIIDNVDSSNYGPPLVGLGSDLFWGLTASMVEDETFSQKSRLVEFLVNSVTGVITSVQTLWSLNALLYSSADQLNEIDAATEAQIQATFGSPDPPWGGSKVTSHTVLMPGGAPTSKDRTTYNIWEGTKRITQTWGPFPGSNGTPTSYSLPSSNDFSFSSTLEGSRQPHAPLPAPLPAKFPNTTAGSDRILWKAGLGSPTFSNNNSRGLSTRDGWRFYAALLPAGPFQLGRGSESVNAKEYEYLGAGWSPEWFDSVHTNHVCSKPINTWCYETFIFSINPNNEVISIPLMPRFSGIKIQNLSNDPATGLLVTTPMPIPDNVWQWLYFSEIDRVVWFHDFRSSWLADPQPSLTVTDKELNVIYRIPPSDLFTITLFTANQYLTASPTVAWAFAGQDTRKRHCIDNEGPLMKGYVRNGQPIVMLGTESFDFVEPVAGSTGTTFSRSTFIEIGASEYSVIRHSTSTQAWTYPTITSGNQNGRAVMRNLSFLGDRAVFRRGSNSLRQVL